MAEGDWPHRSTPTGTITVRDAYGWDYRGLPYAGLLQWYPDLEFGSYTLQRQAAWTVSGSGTISCSAVSSPWSTASLSKGWSGSPTGRRRDRSQKPIYNAAMTPGATSTESGTVRSPLWNSTWDRDDKTLTYDVYRDGGPSIATVTQDSVFWKLPGLGHTRHRPAGGSTHTYKVRAKDSDGNVQWSAGLAAGHRIRRGTVGLHRRRSAPTARGTCGGWGTPVPAARTAPASATARPRAPPSVRRCADRRRRRVVERRVEPQGVHDRGRGASHGRDTEAWVKTTSSSGGRILGFGDSSSGTSSTGNNDLVLYLDNSGRVNFALNNGAWRSVTDLEQGRQRRPVAPRRCVGRRIRQSACSSTVVGSAATRCRCR